MEKKVLIYQTETDDKDFPISVTILKVSSKTNIILKILIKVK